MVEGACETQELFDGPLDLVWVLLQEPQLVWVLNQVVHGVADGVAGGFVTSYNKKQEVGVKIALG